MTADTSRRSCGALVTGRNGGLGRLGVSQMHISRLLRQAVARLREAAQVSEEPAQLRKHP